MMTYLLIGLIFGCGYLDEEGKGFWHKFFNLGIVMLCWPLLLGEHVREMREKGER